MPSVPRFRRLLTPLLLPLCTVIGCAGDDVRWADDSVNVSTETQLPTGMPQEGADAPFDTVRTPAGNWTLGLAENKLRSARLEVVRLPTEIRRPGLGVPGTRYTIDASQLEIFLYADAIARGRDTDGLDLARVAPGSAQPALVADGNLAALVYSPDATLATRVRDALRIEPDDGPLEPAGVVPPRGARPSATP